MNFKKLIVAASLATALSTAALSASATTIVANSPTIGSSFSDFVVGTIHIDSLSDLTGSLFAATSISYASLFTLTLSSVTFTSGEVSTLTDLDSSATGFSFKGVSAGDYVLTASGTLANDGQIANTAFLGANYTVSAVPEPESYAMLLAGLGLMGTIARRRSKGRAV